MKTIGFIGACDKLDLMLYIAKLLEDMGKRVLMIDATILQKARYVIPAITPTKSYVTTYENIDVTVGLYNYSAVKRYLDMPDHATLTYDYIFLDVDSPEALQSFDLKTANKNYFVTNFSVYSLKRGMEILSGITEPIPLTKVLFTKNATEEEDNYLNLLSMGCKVIWDEEKIYFPFEKGDASVLMENQRISKVKIKKLSRYYKQSLVYMAEQILDNSQESFELRKAVKQLEKGV